MGPTITAEGTQTTRTAEQITQSASTTIIAPSTPGNGDWTTYGQEIDAMKADLDELAQLTGVPIPTTIP